MTKIQKMLIWAFCLLLAPASKVAGQTIEQQQRVTLKGLKRIGVVVERSLDASLRNYGLDEGQLQTEAEIRVRQAGIHVLPIEEIKKEPGQPFLYIVVTAESRPQLGLSDLFFYKIRVELEQEVLLVRDPSIMAPGVPTWQVISMGTVGRNNLRDIRQSVEDTINQFINAYLAANQ